MLVLPAAQAGIVTIDLNALGGQRHFADGVGTGLPDGNQIRIGTFDAGFETDVNNGDLVALNGKFNQIGAGTTITIFSQSGRFGGSFDANDNFFAGQRLYIWALNTTDNNVPDAGFSNVAEHGIYTNSGSWLFPNASEIPNLLLETNAINQAVTGGIQAGFVLTAAVVPEPTGAILSLVALVSIMAGSRHRRRKSTDS